MVWADSCKISLVSHYSGTPYLLFAFRLQDYHLLWLNFPEYSTMHQFKYWGPTTPIYKYIGLGSSLFARHYSGNRILFLFLRVLRCFTSPGSPPYRIIRHYSNWVPPFGYLRIKAISSSPKLIAGIRALHRLSVPRHPPCALSILSITFSLTFSSDLYDSMIILRF